jgi:chromosome segregation ATPase
MASFSKEQAGQEGGKRVENLRTETLGYVDAALEQLKRIKERIEKGEMSESDLREVRNTLAGFFEMLHDNPHI